MTTLRRIPVVATTLVLLAVAAMIALGFWQLRRLAWKESLIAKYTASERFSAEVPFPRDAAARDAAMYRFSSFDCARVVSLSEHAGRSAGDQSGWAHVATCEVAGGGRAEAVLGWSRDPAPVAWRGGEVRGFIGPGRGAPLRVVAVPPLAGLEAMAHPDPRDIPNNHLSYAVQWFLFAATALAIYAIALRRRLRADD